MKSYLHPIVARHDIELGLAVMPKQPTSIGLAVMPKQPTSKVGACSVQKTKESRCYDIARFLGDSVSLTIGDLSAKFAYAVTVGVGSRQAPTGFIARIRKVRPETLLGSEGLKKALDIIQYPFKSTLAFAGSLYPIPVAQKNLTLELMIPVAETAVFGWGLQLGLLRALPKLAIKKFYPGKQELVDHKIAEVARIVFCATIFALAHTDRWDEPEVGTVFPMITGLCIAIVIEKGREGPLRSLALATVAHTVINMLELVSTLPRA